MGFTFNAPDPQLPLAPDEIPQFSAFDAMNESCFPEQETPPLLPPSAPAQANFLPATATAPRDGDQKAQDWTAVQTAWNSGNTGASSLLVEKWTSLFGWDDPSRNVAPNAQPTPAAGTTPPAPVFPIQPFTPLVAKPPQHMIDEVGIRFIGAPSISVPLPTPTPAPAIVPHVAAAGKSLPIRPARLATR